MKEITTYERMKTAYEHKEADRVPIIDVPWTSTLARWKKEGMPEDADFFDYFGLDKICKFDVDNSPRYPIEVLEETDEYKLYKTAWGTTIREGKDRTSSLEFLDFSIVDWDSWNAAKARMTPDKDRIPWDFLNANYKYWRENGYWVRGRLWFGFDVTHSWSIGTVPCLMAMLEDPEFVTDQFNHQLDICLELMDMVIDAGFTFDEISWDDDMGYKHSQFFSLETYRELVKPVHKRAIDWAHSKGMKAHMHSCGDINPFLPELIEIGLDAINPLEVKAGMSPEETKAKYGDKILLRGGFDPQHWHKREETEALIRERLPVMMKDGGYLFSSDHSIPDSVSLEDYKNVVKLVKEVGRY